MSSKLFRDGKQLCLEGEIENGLKKIEKAFLMKPRVIVIRAHYAFWLQESKRYEKAIEVATKGLKLTAKNVMCHTVIFESSLRLGDVAGCEAALRRMDKCRSKTIRRMCKVGEKRLALEDYKAARSEVPGFHEDQDTVRTIQACEKGLRKAPHDHELLGHKLWALYEQERYGDVVTAFNSAPVGTRAKVLASSSSPEILAKSLYMLSSVPEAIQALEEAYKDLPSSVLLENLKQIVRSIWILKSGDAKPSDKMIALYEALEICDCDQLPQNIPLKKSLLIMGIETTVSFRMYTVGINLIQKLIHLPLPKRETHCWKEKSDCLEQLKEIASYKNNAMNTVRAFRIFKLTPEASLLDVKNCRQRLLKKYHPDKNFAEEEKVWMDCYKSLTQELDKCFKYLKCHDFQANKKQLKKQRRKPGMGNLSMKDDNLTRLVKDVKKMREDEQKRNERAKRKQSNK